MVRRQTSKTLIRSLNIIENNPEALTTVAIFEPFFIFDLFEEWRRQKGKSDDEIGLNFSRRSSETPLSAVLT
ncbi:hypothetical protein GQ457_13G019570 [Hibiscus cannabinus]